MQYVFNEYFRGFLNYGRLDADYDEFETDINPNDAETIIEDASFLNPRNAPEFTLGIGGTLSVPLGDGDLETFVKYTRIAEVDANLLNLKQSKIAERDDVAASIGYYTDKWSVVAFGKNLTDERYEVFPIATLFAAVREPAKNYGRRADLPVLNQIEKPSVRLGFFEAEDGKHASIANSVMPSCVKFYIDSNLDQVRLRQVMVGDVSLGLQLFWRISPRK